MPRTASFVLSLRFALALTFLGGQVPAAPLPEFDAAATTRPAAAALARTRALAAKADFRRLARIASFDERAGVPSFVWANRAPAAPAAARPAGRPSADAAARAHLAALAPLWGLRRADLLRVRLHGVHDTGRGAIIASYRQAIDGIEVFRDELEVCLDRDLALVAVSGSLPAVADLRLGRDSFALPASQAAALALRDFASLPAEPAAPEATGPAAGGFETFAARAPLRERTDGLAVAAPVRARRTWFRAGETLEPAWYVEVAGETAACATVWSARDGRLLFRHSLVQDAAYSYRVWANAAPPFDPLEGPQGDGAAPHPTGLPDLYMPALVAPGLVTLQNGPLSTLDPWLAPGATETVGNNVDACLDLVPPNGFTAGDLRATTTSPGAFDRVYDTTLPPGASADQRMASATTLFYLGNYLHDQFYDSGFDEAAGNAQADNYGRGGLGGDPLLAEGQDYSGANNANMYTPADGASPRLQTYVFNPLVAANLIVGSPADIAGTGAAGTAAFGPQAFSLTAQVVAARDSLAPVDDACTAPATDVAGRIALADRGTCSYVAKALVAQAAGAVGLVIVDSVAGSVPPGMPGTGAVVIPVLSVTQAEGARIRAQLGAGVTVTMYRPTQLQRDGAIDAQIVAHEWGHYISNRLIGDASGLSNQQGRGMGEGWGDFHSLLLTVRPGDDLAGAYAVGGYVLSGNLVATNAYYFGARRYPYSTDMNKDPLTFRHIQNFTPLPSGPPLHGDSTGSYNAEVHATGEVWCTMLWECYAALLGDTARLTFDQARQRMMDILVAGYRLTPSAPTFVEARDALLAAALAGDPADFALMAQAFAKRGLGTGAVAPPRDATDNIGVTESFVAGGDLAIAAVTLTDDLHSCDDDSYLDNGERGTLATTIVNSGATVLGPGTVTVTSPSPGVGFPLGNVVATATTQPFASTIVNVPVELSGAADSAVVHFDIAADGPGLLAPGPRVAAFEDRVHADEAPAVGDDVEAHHTAWSFTAGAGSAGAPWARVEWAVGQHAYHVEDAGGSADLRLVSPPIEVSPTEPFRLSFQQRYSFEQGGGVNWDGGVVELSSDGGATWTDVGASAAPGYTGTITNTSGNPLGGRSGWIGASAGYPAFVPTTLDLGTAYAGQTIRIRFRHGADAGVGGPGWWVDDLLVAGAAAPPFLGLAPEPGTCTPLAAGDAPPAQVTLALAGAHPARGVARLRFALPSTRHAQLTVHDLAGRQVATLADGVYGAGWHFATFSRAGARAPGVYFARLRVDGAQYVQRLVVLR